MVTELVKQLKDHFTKTVHLSNILFRLKILEDKTNYGDDTEEPRGTQNTVMTEAAKREVSYTYLEILGKGSFIPDMISNDLDHEQVHNHYDFF